MPIYALVIMLLMRTMLVLYLMSTYVLSTIKYSVSVCVCDIEGFENNGVLSEKL